MRDTNYGPNLSYIDVDSFFQKFFTFTILQLHNGLYFLCNFGPWFWVDVVPRSKMIMKVGARRCEPDSSSELLGHGRPLQDVQVFAPLVKHSLESVGFFALWPRIPYRKETETTDLEGETFRTCGF